MTNQKLTLCFVLFTTFLFCQKPGMYVSKINNSKVEIFSDSTIKFDFLNLGKRDSIVGRYSVKSNKITIKYSLYNYFINVVNCESEDFGILIQDDNGCLFKGFTINERRFSTNFISFMLNDFKSKNDTLNLKISSNCIDIHFDEFFVLNTKRCYMLNIQFNPTPFDIPRFSEIFVKNSKSLIIDGIKYRYIDEE